MYNTSHLLILLSLQDKCTYTRWSKKYLHVTILVYQLKCITCLVQTFQELEKERIAFLRNSMWTYTNLGSTNCVKADEVGP